MMNTSSWPVSMDVVSNSITLFRLALNRLSRLVSYWLKYFRWQNPAPIEILHRSEHFLVVNKPHDLVLNSDDPTRDSLHSRMARQMPELADFDKYQHGFLIPHRLDFSTSGVLVTPLTKRACRAANAAFQGRNTSKFYLAVLRGHVNLSKGRVLRIDCGIGQDARPDWKDVRMTCSNDPWCQSPRPSTTRLVVLSRGIYAGYPATKVLLQPVSGRRHQLRVHCKWLGHLIVGDYTYSDRREQEPFRMFLHAQRIILPNSVETLDIVTKQDPFIHVEANHHTYEEVEKLSSLGEGYDSLSTINNENELVV